MDSRLAEMMEYESSTGNLSKSSSIISDTQGMPSVADELEPSPVLPEPLNYEIKKHKEVLTPQKQHYSSILLKAKKYIQKREF